VTPESPRFELEPPLRGGCGFGHVRKKDNVITVDWSTVPESRAICYGEGAPDAALTVRFVGSDATLMLHGPLVRAGEYYFYDSL
ncbi:MAG TPA: hypothetical protein VE907_20610, partial [Gammaproteobacteria bacterium]|nr:hypothetical protein [Gammaproteobacteria bacterium]